MTAPRPGHYPKSARGGGAKGVFAAWEKKTPASRRALRGRKTAGVDRSGARRQLALLLGDTTTVICASGVQYLAKALCTSSAVTAW